MNAARLFASKKGGRLSWLARRPRGVRPMAFMIEDWLITRRPSSST